MPRAGMREIAISYGCFQGLRSRPAGSAVIGNVCMGEASQSDANRRIEFERRHPIFGCVTSSCVQASLPERSAHRDRDQTVLLPQSEDDSRL